MGDAEKLGENATVMHVPHTRHFNEARAEHSMCVPAVVAVSDAIGGCTIADCCARWR